MNRTPRSDEWTPCIGGIRERLLNLIAFLIYGPGIFAAMWRRFG